MTFDPRLQGTSSSASLLAILRDFYVPDFISRYWNTFVRIARGKKDIIEETTEFLGSRKFSAMCILSFSPLRSDLSLHLFFHKANIDSIYIYCKIFKILCNAKYDCEMVWLGIMITIISNELMEYSDLEKYFSIYENNLELWSRKKEFIEYIATCIQVLSTRKSLFTNFWIQRLYIILFWKIRMKQCVKKCSHEL